MMRSMDERYTPSLEIADVQEFGWLGLADTAWLEIVKNCELLTADAGLYVAALNRGHNATNFNHLREAHGTL